MKRPIITLTTDFGDGPFAGIMKGVILGLAPQAALVDLCHAVPPQDVRAGALVLEQALGVFPPGAVHLAVVDPGVGSSRRPICVSALGMHFVGPDNGLLTPALTADPQARVRLLAESKYFRNPVSDTFHGRDIFAPAAAHLAGGLDPARLGPLLDDPKLLEQPRPREEDGLLRGAALGADRFGNLTTNLDRQRVEAFLAGRACLVRLGDLTISGLSRTYAEVAAEEPLALFDSLGRLELALNQGSLCARLGLQPGGVFGLEVEVMPL